MSIVLIIIGLLVAGVTGGASLIESARFRAAFDEFRQYQQATMIFVAARDRLPGDLNEDGLIGYKCVSTGSCGDAETYTTSSFSSPYNTKVYKTATAPYIELYLENIIDFQPDPSLITSVPQSKTFKNVGFYFFSFGSCYTQVCRSNFFSKIRNGSVFLENYFYNDGPLKLAKKLDEKYDDGIFNSGNIRSKCRKGTGTVSANYDDNVDNCPSIYYKIK